MTNNAVIVSRAGIGKTGYCKVCASSLLPRINKLLKEKVSYQKIIDFAKEFDFHLSKPTIASHKRHITDPRVSFVEQAKAKPVIRPEGDVAFLTAIRDLSSARIMEHPEEVTVEHGLAAVKLMMQERRGPDKQVLMLVKVMTGKADEVIQGEYKQIDG